MSEENILSELSLKTGWAQIERPKEDDDEYTIGYYNGEPIRSASSIKSSIKDGTAELTSGPYTITLIDSDDSRMVFVERQSVSEQEREVPKAKLEVYSKQVTITLPKTIINEFNINPGQRFRSRFRINDKGNIDISLGEEGSTTVTVTESFNKEKMTHKYEIRLPRIFGRLIDPEDGEHYADWSIEQENGKERIIIQTPLSLIEYTITEEQIREKEPVKISFKDDSSLSYYSFDTDDEKVKSILGDKEGKISFKLSSYNNILSFIGKREKTTAKGTNVGVMKKKDDKIEVQIPEEVGDILRLYDKSWVRLYVFEDEIIGIPSKTYGEAPLIK